MYTPTHKERIIQGWCTHLINGGEEECPNPANKYWVYLQEGTDMRLEITAVIPVCIEHAYSIRASFNVNESWLSKDYWELIDRSSASYYLIEESLD